VKSLKNFVLLLLALLVSVPSFCSSVVFEKSWGVQGTKNGQFSDPQGIFVDGKDLVYVADTLNHRIQVFDKNGKHKTSFGSYGSENGEFLFPHDIVVDSKGFIYVADSQNGRVQKFSSKNKFVKAWGSKGPEPGQFDGPMYLAIDKSDRIYVGDAFNQRVQVFDNEGTLILTVGAKVGMFDAMNPGNLATVSGLSVDNNGYIYISDDIVRRIQKYDPEGNFVAEWGSGYSGKWGQPGGSTIDSSGNLHYINKMNNMVVVLDPKGSFLFEWGGSGTASGLFTRPIDLYFSDDGSVFVLEQSGNRIQRFGISY